MGQSHSYTIMMTSSNVAFELQVWPGENERCSDEDEAGAKFIQYTSKGVPSQYGFKLIKKTTYGDVIMRQILHQDMSTVSKCEGVSSETLEKLWEEKVRSMCGFSAFCKVCGGPSISSCACAKKKFMETMTHNRLQGTVEE